MWKGALTARILDIGCKAIFLTSDAPVLGTRWKDTRNAFHSWFLPRFRIANVEEVVDPSEPLVEAASHFQGELLAVSTADIGESVNVSRRH